MSSKKRIPLHRKIRFKPALPPHTWETHRRAEAKKPFIIAVVALLAIGSLSLLVFFTDVFVGQATFHGHEEGKIVLTGHEEGFVIGVNVNDQSGNGVFFEMTLDIDCDKVKVKDPLFEDFNQTSCVNRKLTFGDATLDDRKFKTDEFDIVNVTITDFTSITINFPKFDVYETVDGDDLFPNLYGPYTVTPDTSVSDEGTPPPTEQPAPPSPPSGGGRRCYPEWRCSVWSYCDNTLQQTRTCTDLECKQKDRIEMRDCAQCDESWVCSEWSACSNGRQTRTCIDEHHCETYLQRPEEQRSCTLPTQPTPPTPPAYQPPRQPTPQVQKPAAPSFWEGYGTYLLAGLLALIVLTGIAILTIHHFKPHHYLVYNFNELKNWIRKEQQMGTPNADIRTILAEKTGWHEDEISEAFAELRQESGQPALA